MRRYLSYLLASALLVSCVENDLPYPLVVPSVTSLEVEGAVSVSTDSDRRTISITMDEIYDLSAVKVTAASYSEEMTTSEPSLVATHDLTSPKKITLRTYQDYVWTVSATQPIERYFTIQGQVGASVIDDVNRRAVAYVQSSANTDRLAVSSLKLGPRNITTYSPEIADMHNFTNGLEVRVSYAGKTEIWNLYVEQTETVVEMAYVEPWSRVAWVKATGVEGRENGFRYRPIGASEWIPVSDVKSEGGQFTASIDGLEPETAYECVAFSGADETSAVQFTTDPEQQLPNAGFNTFSHAESGNYYSWFDPASAFPMLQSKWWDSGNVGSTTVGAAYSIALPDTGDCKEGAASACLVSRNVIIKFAAGNTFSGEFSGLVGTQGGIINFGRPFTLRPRAMKLWMKYEGGKIDCMGTYPDNDPVKIGDPDRCQLWVALGNWDYRKFGGTKECPVQVNTTDKSTLFSPDSDAVIAYGSFTSNKSTDGWIEIEIPIDYRSVTTQPTHIIVSFASSLLGDYFTGSSTSRLWVDDVRLIY